MESRTFIKYKAWNNSLPMDNVQLKKKLISQILGLLDMLSTHTCFHKNNLHKN